MLSAESGMEGHCIFGNFVSLCGGQFCVQFAAAARQRDTAIEIAKCQSEMALSKVVYLFFVFMHNTLSMPWGRPDYLQLIFIKTSDFFSSILSQCW